MNRNIISLREVEYTYSQEIFDEVFRMEEGEVKKFIGDRDIILIFECVIKMYMYFVSEEYI